jgi:hypothetical protein
LLGNGTWKPYLNDAHRDALAGRDRLLTVLPDTVAVRAVVCTVGANLTIAASTDAVSVLDADHLVSWLARQLLA